MTKDSGNLVKVNKEVEALLDMFIDDVMVELFSEEKNLYENIEDYKQKTGKRFRMTKDQKLRKLTREAAFIEFIKNKS